MDYKSKFLQYYVKHGGMIGKVPSGHKMKAIARYKQKMEKVSRQPRYKGALVIMGKL